MVSVLVSFDVCSRSASCTATHRNFEHAVNMLWANNGQVNGKCLFELKMCTGSCVFDQFKHGQYTTKVWNGLSTESVNG